MISRFSNFSLVQDPHLLIVQLRGIVKARIGAGEHTPAGAGAEQPF